MFTPDPKYFTNSIDLQKTIDKLQVSAPWKITKYAEAYINPIITSNSEKQPMIRLLMLIDSGGSLNLISKKLIDILKLPNKIRETNDEEFLNAVPQYSHFLVVKNLPFVIIDSPDYMFSIGKMAQRKYKIPIDRIEEFFPTDYRLNQDEPGNNPIINETIENAMQNQLLAEEKDEQDINRTGYPLEEL
ncbi:hypothetical protein H8356DRAFT_906072, partial [Neocallimastix lanati (nom. inval.)]